MKDHPNTVETFLSPSYLNRVRFTALSHQFGKLFNPDAVRKQYHGSSTFSKKKTLLSTLDCHRLHPLVKVELSLDSTSFSHLKKRPRPSSLYQQSHRKKNRNESCGTSTKCEEKQLFFTDPDIKAVELEIQQDDECEAYYQAVLMSRGFGIVSSHYRSFMVQEKNENRKLVDDFIVTQRRPVCSGDQYSWLYICQCNAARTTILSSMTFEVEKDLGEDLEGVYEECHHIKITKKLMEHVDLMNSIDARQEYLRDRDSKEKTVDHLYVTLPNEADIYTIESSEYAFCVTREQLGFNSCAVVKVVENKLFCRTCKAEQCDHIKSLQKENKEYLPDFSNSKAKMQTRYVPVSISKEKIPFSYQTSDAASVKNEFSPDDKNCICGSEWGDDLEQVMSLYTLVSAEKVKVINKSCLNCREVKCYDGVSDGILNMGTYLVSHQVLRAYMRQFLSEGTSITAYYKEWCWSQFERGNIHFNDEMTYQRFKYSWYAFLALLDISYTSAFCCPDCGDCPETVVMDGVTLGIRKAFMPWASFEEEDSKKIQLDGSNHASRVFINSSRTRDLLKKYAAHGLSVTIFGELIQMLRQYCPALLPLMEKVDFHAPPESVKSFLKTIASNYPVSGYFRYNLRLYELVGRIVEGQAFSDLPSEDVIFLAEQCPVLVEVLKTTDVTLLKPVLMRLIEKSQAPFTKLTHQLPEYHGEDNLSFFPTLPKMFQRGNYVLDSKIKNKDFSKCQKKHGRHPTLTPGLFTMSCIHGVCYGFHLMDDVESPNVPFTILRTRFHTAPKVIIYDNACNLHAYCLNRDPTFFRDTWFLVDRFHWCNHTGCPEGYSLGTYPQFQNINTQVAEQLNSNLKKIKPMLSYMNVTNFMSHLKLFTWFRGMLSIAKSNDFMVMNYFEIFKKLTEVFTTR